MILCRTKNAVFSHVFKPSLSSLLHLYYSSSSKKNKTNPNLINPKSPSSKSPRPTSSKPSISNLSPKTTLYTLLTDLVSCPTDTDTAIDNVLDCYKAELTSDLVLRVLMSYNHLGRTKTLKFFSWAGTKMDFQFDDSVIEYMVDFFGRRKLFDDIKCLLMTIVAHKGQVSSKALSICIRFLGREGRINEVLSLFDEMESVFGCKPDNLVCNNVLYVLCKKQSSEEMIELALSIFDKIESPDTYSCSNMIVGLCRLGRFEAALEIFRKMDRVGVHPTRSAMNVLIGDLCLMSAKEGSVEKVKVTKTRRPYSILVPNMGGNRAAIQPAVEVFSAVVNSGLLPSTFVVFRLMSELCRLGNTEEAVKVLRIVEEKKLTCVQEGYSIVIKALCDHRRVEEAGKLFGRMLEIGLKPKLVVYNSVISMLCKLGDLDNANGVFEIMNKNRCFPDSITYIALIHAQCACKNWKVAYELLMEMLGLGWIPHFHTYNLVDSLLREHDQLDLCHKLERKLENQKLLKLCKEGQLGDAYEKVKAMLEKGVRLSAYARDTFEHEFQKCGKLEIAHDLLEKTRRVQEPQEINRS
ncbi:putative tetratricopeptide-like helical domain-containing protein [Medicago truncatula]|uniref:PPR containing plant-like protein n=1 Tax=Medicago truncatula TaxID=3880 RepID=G7KUA7_MEDTR|nr:pentatricopeptide repeat-containing protein At1g62910 [Medicago truncatula]AES80557.1 PPR containing plant-like protein [Medicago truncatula]RHN47240.1 putative tetratricopeptide-like helical domain-containing protein [Medicago truncatula]